MNFNTPQYAILLFVVFWTYWASRRLTVQHALLLAASYIFYGAWNPKYLVLIIGSTLLAFYTAKGMGRYENERLRRWLCAASIIGNLGVLATFKYFNFFMSEIDALLELVGLSWALPQVHLALPVGISFYTFQTLSYTIDVYRRHMEPTDDLLKFATFVAFFPQLVAGPILRASYFLPQLQSRREFNTEMAIDGVHRILRGLIKKAIFADLVGAMAVDKVFSDPTAFSSLDCAMAVYGYALQIYADFSGYSDIAIGSAQMLGFRVPENFNYPYLAENCRELWRRWHISLSTWLRDYLYIPLGGNRRGPGRTYFNLAVTMLLGGLWHGAATTFVAWGALHGLALAITRWVQRRQGDRKADELPSSTVSLWVQRFLTFHFVCFAWIFFRSPDFATAMDVLRTLGHGTLSLSLRPAVVPLIVGGLALHFGHGQWKRRLADRWMQAPASVQALTIVGVICVVAVVMRVAAPFIYFQF